MSKYVFKNPEVEKALRLVANELGISDEEFDEKVLVWSDRPRACFMLNGSTVLTFSTSLYKEIKNFNPNDWNDSDVIPPTDEDDPRISKIMLVENEDEEPQKGYYDFVEQKWLDLDTREAIECSRYRLYPF